MRLHSILFASSIALATVGGVGCSAEPVDDWLGAEAGVRDSRPATN